MTVPFLPEQQGRAPLPRVYAGESAHWPGHVQSHPTTAQHPSPESTRWSRQHLCQKKKQKLTWGGD